MITITCPGIDAFVKKIEERGKNLNLTYDQALENLVDRATEDARASYREAALYVHIDDWKEPLVKYDKIDTCDYVITAQGEQVCFYEFGAGYTTDTYFGFSSAMPFSVSPGSWSVQDKQEFTKHGRWYSPKGHYYNSIPPTRALFNASQMLLQRFEMGDFEK